MTKIITIAQDHIYAVEPQGIRFINSYDDEDFLPFAVCYENLCQFISSEGMPQMVIHLENRNDYLSLINKFLVARAIGIHDDLNNPAGHCISFMHNLAGDTEVYRFIFEHYQDYCVVRDQIHAFGWHIYHTSELV